MIWWHDFRAWRRGERRVAPSGTRGRIYERRTGDFTDGSAVHQVETKTTFRVKARVIRADGSPDEHLDLTEANNG